MNREGRELLITRLFDAPRELLFKLWTDPKSIPHWWGPRGYETIACAIDPRPGGRWRVASRAADGSETVEAGVIRAYEPPGRLVLTHAWEQGEGLTGTETLVTIVFEEEGGKTRMTFRQIGLPDAASRDGHAVGWSESFDMLVEHLSQRFGEASA
jgi:uncharacterized protein YndB with AHSA1/START domain